jgi:universal stress protein E
MKPRKSSLLVVIDPTAPNQPALVKALSIAKLGECHIHAFMCVYEDIEKSGSYASRKDFKRNALAQATARLKQDMEPCRMNQVPYTTEVVWNSKWVKSLVRSVRKTDYDLLIKSSYQHSSASRFFSKTADFYLMHHCPCPILFTRTDQEWQSNRVLACIDLEATDTDHVRLNKAVMRAAADCVSIMGMDLYLASAWQGDVNLDDPALGARYRELAPEQQGGVYDLGGERVLLRRGNVIETLQSICAEIDPAIVVIGTVARRGIKGKLIGNTAEKLLDAIAADIITMR